jgi:gliding motility-associated transport system permease protein
MSTTLTIAKRELRSSFDSPLAYVVICLALIILGFFLFFFRNYWQANRASLQALFGLAPIGLSVVISVVSMRLLAEEKRSGTLEMLITLPVRDHEVILGKFLGAWGLVLMLVAATVLYPLMMFRWPWHLGTIDTGPIASGYLGLVLYTAAEVSIGLFVSAVTESQVIALFVTLSTFLALHVIGYASDHVEGRTLRDVFAFVSFDTRLASFDRGLINTKDIVYFVSITVGCLMASFRALERRKWA